ncbi:DsbA family protein [Tropicimonas sp. S265A]|uniref:DsbA family protein n=1 Tax=Tropicimonas sp. S265A TaxID=3415134 RepID=UPI003C797C5D
MPLRLPRRALVLGGGVAAAVGWTEGLWPILSGSRALDDIEFRPIDGMPGYRQVASSAATSGGFDPFVGLQVPDAVGHKNTPDPVIPNDPCTALYGDDFDTRVPLAVFTDYNCPYCRVLDRRLLRLADQRASEITLKVHQLPLLGEASLWGARGALAAGQQDAYIAFHNRLMGAAFLIEPNYLREVAKSMNLDGDQLMQDATGPEVSRQIAESRSFATRLGIIGTPGTLVGRTLVMGNVTDALLERLIQLEADEGSAPNCAAFA